MTLCRDAGRDHDGLGRHVVGVADMQVGRVEQHIGKADVVEPPRPKGRDDLVEPGTDPADLRAADAGVDAKRLDELVDGPGRDPLHVGLHHDGIQRLVDSSSRLEHAREEAPAPQLWDAELDVAALGRQHSRAVTVALGDALLRALVTASADHLGRLDLDEFLQDEAHSISDEIDAIAASQRVEQLGQDRLIKGHRVLSLGAFGQEHTEDHSDGPP